MYLEILEKIKELGDKLVPVAGNVADIGVKKAWLTEWDLKIETELSSLINTFPGKHAVFAEEISDTYVNEENVWIIDPISNTVNFISGLPHYAVVLSHMHQGVLQFAVVYDPAARELFVAEKGKGTTLNSKPVKVSNKSEGLMALMGPHLAPGGPQRADGLKLLGPVSELAVVRTFGSLGVHYAYVACGRADFAVTLNKDVFPEFAGKLLVEEAGGKFTDFQGNNFTMDTRQVVASNGEVHASILQRIAQSTISLT